MPNTNRVDDPTLSKLMEVESDLAAQETQLSAQLAAIREKRDSLKSVIGIFSPSAASATPAQSQPIRQAESLEILTSPVQTAAITSTDESNGVNGANGTTAVETASETASKKPRQPRATQAKARIPNKTFRRGQELQNYMRPEFENTSLAQAVSTVLQSQKDEVVSIPEVIGSVFVYETPREVRSKASTRIANILSTGLKSNKWYRGKTGHYSVSKEAAIADLAS